MTLVEEPAGAAVRAVPELPKRLEPLAIAAVRNAAMAAYVWAGRGDGKAADGAATEAMREALGDAHVLGKVVIGEGEKDNAPMLYNGEKVGDGRRRRASTSPSIPSRAPTSAPPARPAR